MTPSHQAVPTLDLGKRTPQNESTLVPGNDPVRTSNAEDGSRDDSTVFSESLGELTIPRETPVRQRPPRANNGP